MREGGSGVRLTPAQVRTARAPGGVTLGPDGGALAVDFTYLGRNL